MIGFVTDLLLRSLMRRSVMSCLALGLCAGTVGAQTTAPTPPESASTPAAAAAPALRGTLTANPIGMLAGFFSGDAEFRAAPAWTFGIGATVNTIDDYNDYRAVDLKLRYYPAEKALRGFSIAAIVGVSTAVDNRFTFAGRASERFTRPSIGTEFSYQWLLGRTSRFAVVTGAGVKRMLGQEGSVDPVNIPLLPVARVSIGYAF
jgi:hypothetical protein